MMPISRMLPKFFRLVALSYLLLVKAEICSGQQSFKDIFESKIQNKLDRILLPEEYLVDLKILADSKAGSTAGNGQYLPGLEVLGPFANDKQDDSIAQIPNSFAGKADLLIVFDKKVSKERAKVAQDIVNRLIEAEGLKSKFKVATMQKDISKVPAPPEVSQPPKDPPFIDQIIKEKDFVSRALIVIWGAFVSIMAIYFVLRRLLITPYSASAQNSQTPPLSQPFNPGVGDQNSNANPTTDSKNGTKEFQYSKKEALFQSIREVGDEAKEQPKKVARILARWVMQSPELTRSAALFVKNCDIKTVEAVCKSMHPSDLEKIIAIQIDEFDPLGDENQRVIDRMRSDLAVLASEHLIKERPDPLNFLKVLSDEDIKSMLEDEDASTIAMVATQVPAHRMQKLYDQLSTEAMTVIIAQVSTLRNTTIEDFESIRDRLNSKAEKLATNLFTDKDRSNSLLQMIAGVKSPTLQVSLMHGLKKDNDQVYVKVRSNIILATDLEYLPSRIRTVLIQAIDADTIGIALSGFKQNFDLLLDGLPAAYQSVFNDSKNRTNDQVSINIAWAKIAGTLSEFISSGVASKTEIANAIRRAESRRNNNENSEDDQSNNDSDEANFRGVA